MKLRTLNQEGSHVIVVILIVAVLGIIGFAGWTVMKSETKTTGSTDTSTKSVSQEDSNVTWSWGGSEWQASGKAPDCPSPLVFEKSPVDVSKATSILYPGQARGGNYKPHGGFRFDGLKNDDVSVVAPMDGALTEGSRYIEQGETQYMLMFTNACGISYRFDHLLTLSPAMQAEVEKLPAAKQDDSRTTRFDNPVSVKLGDEIASSVGFKQTNNASVDFGVYDLRARNEASKDQDYVAMHQNELSQAAYAVCWFDMLQKNDADTVKALPAGDQTSGKTSDYCK